MITGERTGRGLLQAEVLIHTVRPRRLGTKFGHKRHKDNGLTSFKGGKRGGEGGKKKKKKIKRERGKIRKV